MTPDPTVKVSEIVRIAKRDIQSAGARTWVSRYYVDLLSELQQTPAAEEVYNYYIEKWS